MGVAEDAMEEEAGILVVEEDTQEVEEDTLEVHIFGLPFCL